MRTPPLILIVDDNPANLEIFEMRLAANHYDIITAADGEAGLAMVKKHQPDLVLLDIMMPKMDGIEVCRQIRTDATLPFIPIIMVTAKTDTKDVVAGLDAGADEYLTKPVNHAALVARVKSMLRIKSLHDMVLDQSAQLEHQLKTATNIQSLFWPEIPNLAGGSHMWGVSIPAVYVGGDLYDFIPLPDGSFLAYVADVSGKGVPAALIMAALSTKIRSEAQNSAEIEILLENVNNSLHVLTAEEGYFATVVLARYWPDKGRAQLSLAGHLQPIWISEGETRDCPKISGLALGIAPDVKFERKEIALSPGEALLLYSDGVIEAENSNGEMFGTDGLTKFLTNTTGPPWGKALLDKTRSWQGDAPANDDLTIVEIWREESSF